MTVEITGRLVFDKNSAFKIMFELDAILRQVEFCKKGLISDDELLLKIAGKDCFYVSQVGAIISIYQVIGDEYERADSPFIEIDLCGDDGGDGMGD